MRTQRARGPDAPMGRLGWAAALVALFVLVVAGVLVVLSLASGARVTETVGPGSHPPGPTAVAVPRFVGMQIEDARVLADRADVFLDEHQRTSDRADPGTIIEQDPAEGAAVLPGDTVKVVVAQQVQTVYVPDLRGATESQARTRLVEAGLRPSGRFQTYDDDVRKGRVVRTESAAGAEVAKGTTIAYFVSRGPRPTPSMTPEAQPAMVGNYECLPLDDARRQIEDAGLAVGTVLPSEPQSDGSWLVTDQEPAAGLEVQPGTVVQLWVIDPAEPCPA